MPKPSVPEFTLKLVDSSYDVQPTVTTDPFTGQTSTNAGSHVEARTIEIRIKNEPFTSFVDGVANWTVGFYYNIRWKGHYEQDWHEIYYPSDGFLSRDEGAETVYSIQGHYSSVDGLQLDSRGIYGTLPPNGEIDFQVEAMIGYVHRVVDGGWAPWVFTGELSGWSNTQTLNIGTGNVVTVQPTSLPNPSVSPDLPAEGPSATPMESYNKGDACFELDWWLVATVVIFVVVILSVFVMFYLRRRLLVTNQSD